MTKASATFTAAAVLLAAAAPPQARPGAAAASVAAAGVATADATAIRQLIARIYGRYRHGGETRMADALIFAPGTRVIAAANTRLLQGEEGAIESDVFLDAQDHGAVTVDAVRLAPRTDGRIAATVRFSDPENHIRGKLKPMVLERTPAGWRVYDLTLAGQGSYRQVMLDENRDLTAEAGGRTGRR